MDDEKFEALKFFLEIDSQFLSEFRKKDILSDSSLSRMYFDSIITANSVANINEIVGAKLKDLGYDYSLDNAINALNYINRAKILIRMEESRREKENSDEFIALDESWRSRIHGYLSYIRDIIEKADVLIPLKERMLNSLNSFATEVDRQRTRTTMLAGIWLEITEAIGRGAKNLEPAAVLVERMVKGLGRAKKEEMQPRLPPPGDDLLPAPDTPEDEP